jgi:ectoine hydroxylase-related dioxygenase (phytanoyl-CoA dioxygenase family)
MRRPGAPTPAAFDARMAREGWALFPSVLEADAVEALAADCDRVHAICHAVQERNGVAGSMEGAAHHVAGYGGALDDFLAAFPLTAWIDRFFAGKWIVLNYGAVLNPPGFHAYTAKPHRDVRAFTGGYRLSLNMLVVLSDFTAVSGGTRILSGSHLAEAMPSAERFAADADQIVGRAGDIVLFDSLTVHSAAPNRSDAPRRALTLCLGRPFMKPQMDWPRYLPESFTAGMSDEVRQLMGFNARVAASLDEYYQPPERWTFKADQR